MTYEKMKVEIVPYQSRWRDEFASIAHQLRHGLGAMALRIDHIGSTSVPALAAKDIIDVQVTVAALDESVMRAISALGYQHRPHITRDHVTPHFVGADSNWHKLFFREPLGARRINLHARAAGAANQRYPILFRDYLRAHPMSAEAYAELKRRLADNLADPETYPDVKDPAVDLIYLAAEDWATATGWQLPPSDA